MAMASADNSRYGHTHGPSQLACSNAGLRLLSAALHSSYEPSEQWLSHDDSIVNIVIVLLIKWRESFSEHQQ